MKTIIVFLLLALSLMTYNETKAQGCDSPCGDINAFQPAVPLPVSLNGCSYKVDYSVQSCTIDGYQYCIFTIDRLWDFNPSGCYLNNSAKDLLDAASKKIIRWSPELSQFGCTPSGPNDCKENIYSYKAACWKWEGIVPNPDPTNGDLPALIPCDLLSCCESHWMYCNDGYGNPMEPYKTYERSAVPCSSSDPGCIVVCEEMGQ